MKIKIKCDRCNKNFEKYPNNSKYNFCSYGCKSLWQRENLRGKKNPFYGMNHSRKAKRLMSLKKSHSRNPSVLLNKQQIQILNGLLLGDGHIDSNNFSGRYTQGCKHREFLEHVKKILPLEWSPIWYDRRWGCYHIKSHFTPTLLKFKKNWYPDNKKAIPKDIEIAPETLLYWFLSDGSIRFPNKYKFKNSKYFEIKFATDGFTSKDNLFLLSKLRDVGIKASLLKRNQIRILSESKELFFDVIGESPIECYKYKWRWKM